MSEILETRLNNSTVRRAVIRLSAINAVLEGPQGEAFIYIVGSEAPIQTAEPCDRVLHAWKEWLQRRDNYER